MAKKKAAAAARPVVRKIVPVANSVEELQDRVRDSQDEVAIPGRLSDWLTPRPKGKPVLDPVLIAAREAGKKKRGARKRPADGSAVVKEEVMLGNDGLPRPGRR
jgi:hypothetical protein